MGRSAILGEQRNNYFCDVGCGRGEMGDSTYAITKTGLLCEFNNRRLLDKWVELRVCHKPLSWCDKRPVSLLTKPLQFVSHRRQVPIVWWWVNSTSLSAVQTALFDVSALLRCSSSRLFRGRIISVSTSPKVFPSVTWPRIRPMPNIQTR